MADTVRVRIPIRVTPSGKWEAYGAHDLSDAESLRELEYFDRFPNEEPYHVLYVESDVPINAPIANGTPHE